MLQNCLERGCRDARAERLKKMIILAEDMLDKAGILTDQEEKSTDKKVRYGKYSMIDVISFKKKLEQYKADLIDPAVGIEGLSESFHAIKNAGIDFIKKENSTNRKILGRLVWEAEAELLTDPELFTAQSRLSLRHQLDYAKKILEGRYLCPFDSSRPRAFRLPRSGDGVNDDENEQYRIRHKTRTIQMIDKGEAGLAAELESYRAGRISWDRYTDVTARIRSFLKASEEGVAIGQYPCGALQKLRRALENLENMKENEKIHERKKAAALVSIMDVMAAIKKSVHRTKDDTIQASLYFTKEEINKIRQKIREVPLLRAAYAFIKNKADELTLPEAQNIYGTQKIFTLIKNNTYNVPAGAVKADIEFVLQEPANVWIDDVSV